MGALVDTKIKSTVDKKMLEAFLYGIIHGGYKLYKDLTNSKLSIKFEHQDDATIFKLKELDVEFNKHFASNKDDNGSNDPFTQIVKRQDFSDIIGKINMNKY